MLLLFFLRPGASHFKAKIAASIGGALARQVEIGTVHIRLLPQPGFDLENLVVYDDPAFSAEPMLRAPEVTAVLRLTSLARGRIEIARLDLTEPSLNLMRRENGRWNVEALLERSSRTPLAPTAKSKSEPRPGFPYIEGTAGRINFKIGQEKKPYALTNADFALWQDSENIWGVRLQAQPTRVDVNLTDTGLFLLDGTWQRATSLRETPLQFSLEWKGPQLGQLSKFFTGADKGWRGELVFDATLHGTPAQLQVSTDASVQDFRRYDIPTGEPLRLIAHCDARFSSVDRILHEALCSAPVRDGMVTLNGDVGLLGGRTYFMTLAAEHVPVSAMAALARHAKRDLPADLTATGRLDGSFTFDENGASGDTGQFEGRGEISNLHLLAPSIQAELVATRIPLLLSSGSARENFSVKANSALRAPAQPHLEFGPFAVALGRPTPSTARGSITKTGYYASLVGEAGVAHVLRLARLLGLPSPRATAEGTAQMDLQIAGSWLRWEAGAPSGFLPPVVTGTAQLQNVRAEMRGLNAPIEISSAHIQLSPDGIWVDKFIATAAQTRWSGSLALPRGCGTPGTCVVRFNLNADAIAIGELGRWLNPRPSRQPWYRMLSSAPQAQPSFLASLRANGRVLANHLLIHDLVADHVSTALELDSGRLRISDLRADFLGGKHHGDWRADFTAKPPHYAGSGTLTGVSMGQLADAMHDGWVAGTASGTYQLAASGLAASEFWSSAEGTLQFDLHDGMLPHISLANDAGPLQVDRFTGQMRLREGEIDIKDSKLTSRGAAYGVSGTVSFGRDLDLDLTREPEPRLDLRLLASPSYKINGTLEEPQVAPVMTPETRAQLKP